MAQKIKFIASILHEPEFFFLDEPFAGLDPVSTDTLRDNIIELGKQGKTVLFSTHNMDLAERICKKIFIINKGKELISGPLDEVKSKFGKNAVVIEFDGNIDFLNGSDLVSDIIKYPRWVEVELSKGSTADDLLRICAGRLSIKRFEVVAPSLHKIFVKQLGGYFLFPQDLNSINRIDYVSRSASDYKLLMTLEGVMGRAIISTRLVKEGLDPERVKTLITQPGIEVKNISKAGVKEKQDINVLIFTGVGFTLLLYMTVLMYGLAMGRAVLTEKLSKTVEIMLSTVNTRQLLFGKILGKAGAGLFEYAIWIGISMVLLNIIGPRIGVEVFTIQAGPTLFYMVLFFLLAFFLYASIYAALGAASEDEQHLFQLSWPLMIFLILPMVAVGAIMALPDNPVVTVLSLFPLTSPIVMFQRILAGQPPAWQITLSVFILLGTISVSILLSAKIFRIGILMTGKRFTVREVLRWLRYKG